MKKTKLGEFEELVLLTVIVLKDQAYGVQLRTELGQRIGEKLSVGSIQSALKRLEEKGYLSSFHGEATKKRGGKRKKIYEVTSSGMSVLQEMKEIRSQLWKDVSTDLQIG